jgi:hypothetical protein
MVSHEPEGNVPRPEDSRSDGRQGEADAEEVKALAQLPEHHPNHFGEALEEVPEIRGSTAMLFTVAGFRQLFADHLDLQRKLAFAETERDGWRERFHEQNTKRAVLEVQLQSRSFLERIQNVALAFGGVVVGAGLSLVLTGPDYLIGGLVSAAAGVVLMGFGFARPRRES